MIRTVAIVVQRASSRLHMRGPGTGATLAEHQNPKATTSLGPKAARRAGSRASIRRFSLRRDSRKPQ